MARILLLDTNIASAPIVDSLVGRGHEVFPVGANPEDFLALTCPTYQRADYADKGRVLELGQELAVDHILPGCNDRSYLTVAQIAATRPMRGMDPLDVVMTINDKGRFRSYAAKRALPSPRPWTDAAARTAGRALIVKPVDSFSGRGVTVLRQPDAASVDAAVTEARRMSAAGRYVIEDYVEGELFSHTAFIAGKRIAVDFIVEEKCTINPFTVDTSRLDPRFSPAGLQQIRAAITDIAEDLALADGLVHTQFLWDGTQVSIVEITRRCPGDLYSLLISLSTGCPYADNYAQGFLAERFTPEPGSGPVRHVMRHTISQPRRAHLGAIRFHEPVKILQLIPLARSGAALEASPYGRAAHLFAECDSEADLAGLMHRTATHQLYTVTDGPSL